ncbi:MAG: guanine deaminase, partial [Pseudomonadota bacterium]
EEGSEADLVVLNSQATAAMALRMETVRTLSEELFVLQTMADDRAIADVYAAVACEFRTTRSASLPSSSVPI